MLGGDYLLAGVGDVFCTMMDVEGMWKETIVRLLEDSRAAIYWWSNLKLGAVMPSTKVVTVLQHVCWDLPRPKMAHASNYNPDQPIETYIAEIEQCVKRGGNAQPQGEGALFSSCASGVIALRKATYLQLRTRTTP